MLMFMPIQSLGNTVGIINEQTVLTEAESEAKTKLEKKKEEVLESIKNYASEIKDTNLILVEQIREMEKVLLLKKEVLMAYREILARAKNRTIIKQRN